MKKILTIIFLLVSAVSFAENTITVAPAKVESGKSSQMITLTMTTDQTLIACQFDLYVPTGMSYALKNITLIGRAEEHDSKTVKKMTTSDVPGYDKYRHTVYSTDEYAFSGESGDEFMQIALTVGEVETGLYPVYVKGVKFSTPESKSVSGTDSEGVIGVNQDPTGIESIEAADDSKAVVYDMAGRRVNAAAKGVKVINGKKVIK